MKQIFFKSNKGVQWSSLMSAVFSAVQDSPVNEDWLFKKQNAISYSIIRYIRKGWNGIGMKETHKPNALNKARFEVLYLTTRCFEVSNLTSPGKRSPGSKITISPGTTSLWSTWTINSDWTTLPAHLWTLIGHLTNSESFMAAFELPYSLKGTQNICKGKILDM